MCVVLYSPKYRCVTIYYSECSVLRGDEFIFSRCLTATVSDLMVAVGLDIPPRMHCMAERRHNYLASPQRLPPHSIERIDCNWRPWAVVHPDNWAQHWTHSHFVLQHLMVTVRNRSEINLKPSHLTFLLNFFYVF